MCTILASWEQRSIYDDYVLYLCDIEKKALLNLIYENSGISNINLYAKYSYEQKCNTLLII